MLSLILAASIKWPAVEGRKRNEVCRTHKNLFIRKAGNSIWTANTSACGIGSHSEQDRIDSVNKVNYYRFMVGLTKHEVVLNPAYDDQCYKGALILSTMRALSHQPPKTAECWTQEGYNGCSSSNIASGVGSAAFSIDLYVDDGGVDSLGHRRWILYPPLAEIGIGLVSRYSTLKVIGTKNLKYTEYPFVAYPAPGWNVAEAIKGVWSFSLNQVLGKHTVTVMNGTKPIDASLRLLQTGYGMHTFAIEGVNSRLVRDGDVYDIKITNTTVTYEYQVKVTNCATLDPDGILEMSWFGGLGFALGISLGGILLICVVVYVIFRKTITFHWKTDSPDEKPKEKPKNKIAVTTKTIPVGHSKPPLASDVPAAYAK